MRASALNGIHLYRGSTESPVRERRTLCVGRTLPESQITAMMPK
jgi:hypothetical protein